MVRTLLNKLIRLDYFWGEFFGGVSIYEVDTPTIAYTDGRDIFLGQQFFLEDTSFINSEAVRMFVLAHEVLHIAFNHVNRRKERQAYLFNIACDAVINSFLEDYGFTIPAEGISFVSLYKDTKIKELKGKSWLNIDAEGVYDLLLSYSDEIATGVLGDDIKEGSPQGSILVPASGDRVEPDKVSEIMKQAADDVSGRLPGINSEVTSIAITYRPINTNRTVYNLLDKFLTKKIRAGSDYRRPHKKLYSQGVYYPSKRTTILRDITLCVDVSGSIKHDEVQNALYFCKKLIGKYQPSNYRIITFNSSVVDVLENRLPTRLGAGGGTEISSTCNEIKSGALVLVVSDLDVGDSDLNRFEKSMRLKNSEVVYLLQSNSNSRDVKRTKNLCVPLY